MTIREILIDLLHYAYDLNRQNHNDDLSRANLAVMKTYKLEELSPMLNAILSEDQQIELAIALLKKKLRHDNH